MPSESVVTSGIASARPAAAQPAWPPGLTRTTLSAPAATSAAGDQVVHRSMAATVANWISPARAGRFQGSRLPIAALQLQGGGT